MKYNRRDFAKLSGLAALGSFGFSSSLLAQSGGADNLANLSAASFRELLGTEFYVSHEDFSASSVLRKVADFPHKTEGGECFALFFEVRGEEPEQATYNIFHPKTGNFQLMMTAGKDNFLTATINRL